MIVSSSKSKSDYSIKYNFWKFFSIFLLLLILAMVLFVGYLVSQRPNIQNDLKVVDDKLKISEMISSHAKIIPERIESVFTPLETLYVDINHINAQKLDYMREKALLGEKDFESVPVRISTGDKKLKARLRLKGDRKIHFENEETSSYRIRVKGDKTIYGMKSFSIHKPRARNYLYEWVYLELMKSEGIMAPIYKFVNLNINGKAHGLYVIEEHYDKHLIERYKKKEGPIVRFKEENLNRNREFVSKYHETPVAPYVGDKWSLPENIETTKKAVYLLEGFRNGQLNIGEVFDVEKMAMFFALTDLSGTHHGSIPKSVRFYYNPVTSKLEPVPFDGHFGTLQQPTLSSELGINPGRWIYLYWKEYFFSFFNDKTMFDREFSEAYFKALSKVSAPGYLDRFFNEIEEPFRQAYRATFKETPLQDHIASFGPLTYQFEHSIYQERAAYIRENLRQPTVYSFINKLDESDFYLDIRLIDRKFPIQLEGIKCNGRDYYPAENVYVLPGKPLNEDDVQSVRFSMQQTDDVPTTASGCNEISYSVVGSDEQIVADLYPWNLYEHDYVSGDLARSKANHHEFNFINTDDINGIISIRPGKHSVKKNLILPEGYTVKAQPGTELALLYGVIIYSRSPVEFIGTKEQPIRIDAPDKFGQGLVVISAQSRSTLEHVIFSNLREPNQNGWKIPGVVSFYESPVIMNSVTIDNNNSEDALNIIRSSFEINDIKINGARSDAIDVDFGNGKIVGGIFTNIGNDSIDVSGTDAEINKIHITISGDKGISVGEDSRVKASDIRCDNVQLCVASKDQSEVQANKITVVNSAIGFTAYQKKSEFGPAKIHVENVNFDNSGLLHLIEKNSTLNIDNREVRGEHKGVLKMIENLAKGKPRAIQ